MAVWGLVLLVVFAGAQYLVGMGFSAKWTWVALAIIIILLNFWVDKSMKKAPKDSQAVWKSLSVFGFLTTLIVAFGAVAVDPTWLMSFWLLIIGAAIFAEGHGANNRMHNYSGLIMVFASLFVLDFGDAYFMAGSLFFGLFGLINGYFSGK